MHPALDEYQCWYSQGLGAGGHPYWDEWMVLERCVGTSDRGPCLTRFHLISTLCLPIKTNLFGKYSYLTFMKEQTKYFCHVTERTIQFCICEMELLLLHLACCEGTPLSGALLLRESLLLMIEIAGKLSEHAFTSSSCSSFFFLFFVFFLFLLFFLLLMLCTHRGKNE